MTPIDAMRAAAMEGLPAARDARDEAIEHVAQGASPAVKFALYMAVSSTARELHEFTADDVWARVILPNGVHEPRIMGAVIMAAARAHVCEPTEKWRQSANVTCHARPMRVWRSLLC